MKIIAATANEEVYAGITDNGKIIFSSGPSGYTPADLYYFTPGGGYVTLANSLDMETYVGSINGRVLYQKTVSGQTDLYSVKTDGTDTQSLASSSLSEEFMRTTSAGRVIYRVNNGGQYDLYSVNADGTGTVTLANSANSEELFSVTANGRVIYRRLVNGQYDLYSVTADGTVTVPLASSASNDTYQVIF
jgi:Tol biopolymer transport system component